MKHVPNDSMPAHPLDLDGPAMRELVEKVLERLIPHLETLGEQPASAIEDGAQRARELAEDAAPEDGAPIDDLLTLLFERAIPCSYNAAGPGYLAYIPGGGIFPAAVADLLADAINRYVGAWLPAPALVRIETNVVRWLCGIVGFPDGAGGVLTSGGSLANLIAVITARRERLPEDFLRGTLYVSDQVHHSVTKAAVLAGFPVRNVRRVPTDDQFRMRPGALADAVAADRRGDFEPFLVVSSGGTTNCGAVDPLGEIADLAEREKLWHHCDAAYGGFFRLTERGRLALDGLERADSVTLDPHKGLFLPFGTGALVVRDPGALRRTHSTTADYMPTLQEDPDLIDFCEISPELSRDFRGLRVWLPIKLHGLDAFRRTLDEKMDLARWAREQLAEIPRMRIVAEPILSLVAFRLDLPGLNGTALDAINQRVLDGVNRRKRVLLTGTVLDGRFTLRICVLAFRTHRERLEKCLEDLRAAVAEALASP